MMGYPEAVAIVGSVCGLAIGGASVIKTLYGKKFCDKHNGLANDIVDIKMSASNVANLIEAIKKLELKMLTNEKDNVALHAGIKESINAGTSWFYDIKLVLDVLSESLIDDETNKKTIEKILNRKPMKGGE